MHEVQGFHIAHSEVAAAAQNPPLVLHRLGAASQLPDTYLDEGSIPAVNAALLVDLDVAQRDAEPPGRAEWSRRKKASPRDSIVAVRERQNDPNTEPSTRTAISARITLTITVITISK